MIDPYRAAGLARNPFVVDGPRVDRSVWLDRGFSEAVVAPNTLVQFLGEKGAGKTAHLLHWQRQAAGPYRHVAPGWNRLRLPPLSGRVVYWDEADRIPPPALAAGLRRTRRRNATVVVGTHQDLSRWARWAGMEVTTIRLGGVGEGEVQQWADLRIRAASIDERLARRVLGEVPHTFAQPTDQASWRDIGDALHSWAATRVREHARSLVDTVQG